MIHVPISVSEIHVISWVRSAILPLFEIALPETYDILFVAPTNTAVSWGFCRMIRVSISVSAIHVILWGRSAIFPLFGMALPETN